MYFMFEAINYYYYFTLALSLHLKHNLTKVKYNKHYINNKNHNFNQQNSHILK